MASQGIHHVTAICGSAQRNLDFYTRTLGLRLVKKTVNFDDPGAYHLYYGDEAGSPGSILTFFPWERAAAGRPGAGELAETVFRVPAAAIGYWTERLADHGLETQSRFGETRLSFRDGDGLRLALLGLPGLESEPAWSGSDVPVAHAIRGVHGVSLLLGQTERTGAILETVFGWHRVATENGAARYGAGGTALGGVIDLLPANGAPAAQPGRGSVHHLAFRAADDAAQAAMAAALAETGLRATEQKNRDYFRSIYFREPGGVLFEIATDAPGFAVDEAPDRLGTALKLPRFLEPRRPAIEAALPALS